MKKTISIIVCMIMMFAVVLTTEANTIEPIHRTIKIGREEVYQRIKNDTWHGEYHQINTFGTILPYDLKEVVSYEEYLRIMNAIRFTATEKYSYLEPWYTNKDLNYIMFGFSVERAATNIDLVDVAENRDNIQLFVDTTTVANPNENSAFLIVIPTKKPIGTKVWMEKCLNDEEVWSLQVKEELHNPYRW